ncbi:MAG: hypothetical protein IPL61_20690 [Myxococcales bacterium]|nr:hypothetical protein [Myxococcales bacterium]
MTPALRRSLLLAALATVAALAAAPSTASACDCAGPNTVASARGRLGVVALGRAVEVKSAGRGRAAITFHVTQAWQGATAGADLALEVDASDCGFQLLPGDEALIYVPLKGLVGGCRGDDTARVVTGAAIAADLTALGPASSAAIAGASVPLVVAGDLIIAEGKVDVAFDGGRPSFRVRVAKAQRGTHVGEVLNVTTAVGACGQALPVRMTDRVTVRARRIGPAAALSPVMISPCLPDTLVKVTPRRRR